MADRGILATRDFSGESQPPVLAADWLAGGGHMGALMRSMDWSKKAVGPVESWSPTLRMMVRLMLWNRLQIFLWWGPQFIQMYNDAMWRALGTKHPRAMGQPASECWSEMWHIIGPLIEAPFSGGEAAWMEDIFLEINRRGFMEETHWTIAYSPVLDETEPSGIGGVIGTVNEITEKIVGERRVLLLRDLGARSSEAKTAEEACVIAARTMEQHREDVPFALLYLIGDDRQRANLAAAAGLAVGEAESQLEVDLKSKSSSPWPLAEVFSHHEMQTVEDLQSRLQNVPPGPWSNPPRSAVVLTIASHIAQQPAGLLVLGISSRLSFDDSYRGFCDLVSGQIATAIANARAYEEERKRAEALAEIDRAKTLFFSNVSHEFRTPLTLMLGPIEEMLSRGNGALTIPRDELELVHRNCLRLMKLVNALLDFSRIEAGRARASYEPVDLATFTVDLASVFRAAIEKAGLRLNIYCPLLDQRVYVDRSMWEKIVLNLLSNAFKFTFEGEITVALKSADQHVELCVSDTGTGIAENELPRVFERFHRIEGARGRTFEGSGIGLALVQELAKLHGGAVKVESEYGKGTQFTVSIPMGKAHLPWAPVEPAQMSHTVGAEAYAQEALRWLPNTDVAAAAFCKPVAPNDRATRRRKRILFADDNADLRRYVHRLLSEEYEMELAPDGEAAFAAAKEMLPDLVLTDVMMPRLDGFGLLKALRDHPATRNVPLILLSARAGEESRIEGLTAGATDYLVKPFSAAELLARVRNGVNIAAKNIEAQRRLHALVENSPDFIGFAAISGKALFLNPAGRRLVGLNEDEVNETVPLDYALEEDRELLRAGLATALEAGTWEGEVRFRNFKTGAIVPMFQHIFLLKESDGRHMGLATISRDLTERKRFEAGLREAHAELARFSRVASMGELTASIAHEINQPLSAIVGNAGACTRMLASRRPDLEEIQLAVKDIADSGRRASEVVSRIRGLLEKSHSEKCRLEINEVIAEVLPLVRGELDKYQAILNIELQNGLPPVIGDRIELQQVLINLLLNGMEAMLSVSDRPRTLMLCSNTAKSGEVVIAVHDSGAGLPPDQSAEIFDAFFTTKPGGMGMGLAISRTIIESHGGKLWATPNQAGGTTFQFSLVAAA